MSSDPLINRKLGRTEYSLLDQFEYYNLHNDDVHIKKCLEVIAKLEKNGWTKSWLFQAKMKPFKELHKSFLQKGKGEST